MHWPQDLLDIQEELTISPNLGINHIDIGKGPILLFIHNSGGFWQIWTAQIRHFAQKYRVIAIDLPQNGKSSKVRDDITLRYFTHVLNQFIKLKKISQLTLIGNCIGASISLNYASHYPKQVNKLLLFNICPGQRLARNYLGKSYIKALGKFRWLRKWSYPFLRYWREDSAYRKQFPAILFSNQDHSDTDLYKTLEKHFCQYDRDLERFKDLYALDSFSWEKYQPLNLSCPLYLFWGEENQVAPQKTDGAFFSNHLRTRITSVPRAGHLCMYEQADFVNNQMMIFLEEDAQ